MVKYLMLLAGSGPSFGIGEVREPTLFLEEKCSKQKRTAPPCQAENYHCDCMGIEYDCHV